MSEGNIYVPVTSKIARDSGNDIGSGNTAGGFYIHWTSNEGWTSMGDWYYAESYLSTGWPLVAASLGYDSDENGFLAYMETGPSNINSILAGWTSYSKNAFKETYENVLKVRGEGTQEDPNYSEFGCIEYV